MFTGVYFCRDLVIRVSVCMCVIVKERKREISGEREMGARKIVLFLILRCVTFKADVKAHVLICVNRNP